MNFNHDLLTALLSTLESTGISTGAGVALRVQQIFVLQGIQSWNDLARARHLIGPVVVRSREEQQRFHSAFTALIQQHVKTATPPPPAFEEERERINKRARKVAVLICATLLLLVPGIYILVNYLSRGGDVKQPYSVSISVSSEKVMTGNDAVFRAVTDSFHSYSRYEWNFGDGAHTVSDSGDVQVNYSYSKAGKYNVVLQAWSDSVAVRDTLQLQVIYDTTCTVTPGFTVSNDAKPNLNAEIRFKNTSTGKCITRYEWNFNDGTRIENQKPTDAAPLIHRFEPAGTYDVTLRAFTADTFYTYTRPVVISDKNEIIPLAVFQPLEKSQVTATIIKSRGYGFFILLLLLLLLIPPLYLLMRFYLRKKQLNQFFEKHYHSDQATIPPYTYETETGNAGIRSDKIFGELAFRLRQPEKNDQLQFDVHDTITHTIQHAGFPKIIFDEENIQPEYLVIADAGSGRNQQAELFKQLLETLGMYRVHLVVFYYSGSMETLFNTSHPEGVPLARVAQQYSRARLLVYSDGHSLLNEHTSDGFATWAVRVFASWKFRALLTPVPRYCWDDEERKLAQLFRLYPAGLYGHLLMAGDFMKGRYQLVPRKNALPAIHPFSGSLRNYKKYFSRPEDKLLYRWLLALSVPEQVSWENTLLAGKAVEARYCGANEQLVTYDNLLRITAIEWLQQGQLSPNHRSELFRALQQEPDAEALQRDINRELLLQTEKTDPPENSAAALSKKIQLALLRYQLRDKNAGTNEEQELHFLQQNGLLGRFANTEVVKESKGYTQLKPGRAFWVRMLGFSIMLGGLFFLFRNPLITLTEKITGTKPKTETVTDSLALYTNKAAALMQNEADMNNVFAAANYIDSAKRFDKNNDDTLAYNTIMNAYRKGLYLYKIYKFQLAAKVLRDSTLSGYSGKAEGTRTLAQNILHAEGVCCYYVSKDTATFIQNNAALLTKSNANTGDFKTGPYYAAFRRYGERAAELNNRLLAAGFYKKYPYPEQNLDRLLKNKPFGPGKSYLLEVKPAAKEKPVISISKTDGTVISIDTGSFAIKLRGGKYRIWAKFNYVSWDTTISLEGNTYLKIPPQSAINNPLSYYISGTYIKSDKQPETLDITVYGALTNNVIYSTKTKTWGNEDYSVPLPNGGKYRFVITTGTDEKIKMPAQSFELVLNASTDRSKMTLKQEIGYNGNKLYANMLDQVQPASGVIKKRPLVVKQEAESTTPGEMFLVLLSVYDEVKSDMGLPDGIPGIVVINAANGQVLGKTDDKGMLFFQVPATGNKNQVDLRLELNGDVINRSIDVVYNKQSNARIILNSVRDLPHYQTSTADFGGIDLGAGQISNGQTGIGNFRKLSDKTIISIPVDLDDQTFYGDDVRIQETMLKLLSNLYPKETFFIEKKNYESDMLRDSLENRFKLLRPRNSIQLIIHSQVKDMYRMEVRVINPNIFEPSGKGIPVAVFECTQATFSTMLTQALDPKHRTNWQEQLKYQTWYKPR